MTTTMLITINAALGLLTMLAVASLTFLAHRLPAAAPHADAAWGTSGDPWVPSDPLPLAQLAAHERDRELVRAA